MSGWKSYVAAAAMAILAAWYFSKGDKGDSARGMEMLLAAMAVVGIRHAIQTKP